MNTLPCTILAAALIVAAAPGEAGPQSGAVVAGEATITHGASDTAIHQGSRNAVIEWQNFSIGQGESVRFYQPSSTSVALNRVLGGDPSSIFGTLTPMAASSLSIPMAFCSVPIPP